MSLKIELEATPVLLAADALEMIDACKNHKLPQDAGKRRLLAVELRQAGEALSGLILGQEAGERPAFLARAQAVVTELRERRAIAAKIRAEKRARAEAERALVLADLAQAA